MIPDWETDTVLISDVLMQRYPQIVRQLESILQYHRVPLNTVPGMADIWIRDAAPVQISEQHFVQFRYRPNYLCNSRDERLITGPEVFQRLEFVRELVQCELIIDGGNIVGTQSFAIVTNKIYDENPDFGRPSLRDALRSHLQVKQLIDIRKEPFDTFGHSDGMVRFVADERVILNDYSKNEPKLAEELQRVLARAGLEVVIFPYIPHYEVQDGITSAVGNYANFLRVGDLIIVPAFGLAEDETVREILTNLLPQSSVVSLPCRDLAAQGGVLNCASWTIRNPGGRRNGFTRIGGFTFND